MGGEAGGIVRHGIEGAAVDNIVGVFALRPDVQPEYGVIRLRQSKFNVIVCGEADGFCLLAEIGQFFFIHGVFVNLPFSVLKQCSIFLWQLPFFFQKGVDKS